jgi:VanZ family protein
MPGPAHPRGRLGRAAFAGVLVVSLVVLFTPAGGVPSAPPGVDKLVHAVLFLALAATGRWAGLRPVVLLAALVAYAAGSEVLQGLSAIGRTASVLDWAADVVGVLVGLALWAGLARPARR